MNILTASNNLKKIDSRINEKGVKVFVGKIFILFVWLSSFACDTTNYNSILIEYDTLLEDLSNIKTFGYKGIIPNSTSELLFPYINGHNIVDGSQESFAIQGKGFFKVYDKTNNKYYFTRCGMFFNINGEYHIHDGTGFRLVSKINPVEKKIAKEQDDYYKFNTSTCDLYYPANENEFTRQGKYFIFSDVKELKNQTLLNGYLELSTVDVLKTITRMLFILKNIEGKNGNYGISGIGTKIFILESLWKITLDRKANGMIEDNTYLFYDLSFPASSLREMPNIQDITWQRRTSFYYEILDMVSYLKRDYF